jgi:type IV secretory pathway protease TraF
MASVLVNDVPLPNMLTKEGSTKLNIKVPRVPRGKYIVKPGTVWVFSSYNVRSYDSRYYGAIDIKQIYSGVEPVFVFSTNTDYVLKTSATPYCFWRLCWFSYPVAQR